MTRPSGVTPPLRTGALVLAALMLAGSAGTAQQPGPPGGVYSIVSRYNGLCLGVQNRSTADGAPVVQQACADSDSQAWTVEPAGDGSYRVTARHTGFALDVAGNPQNGAPLVQRSQNGGAPWTLAPTGDGYFEVVARGDGRSVSNYQWSTRDGESLISWDTLHQTNQQWLLRAVAHPTTSTADIVRFLEQATWGPTPALIEHVREVGIEGYLDEQFAAPSSGYPALPLFPTTRDKAACPDGSTCVRDNYSMYPVQARFFVNALYGEDQLRQRLAFALHQIIVVSGVEVTQPSWMTPYLQVLDRHAFGTYRQLLYDITVNPAMGIYLDVKDNDKALPNENYAREILQLFTIGTVKLNIDGTQELDAAGQPIPTYGQREVNEFARVFTGWRLATAPQTGVPNYRDPMVVNEAKHDTGAKTLLNGGVVRSGLNSTKRDLDEALDNIMEDPNVAPFISKQLIQHLVTSNPSREYVARVATVFNGDGAGTRGDLKAVVRAILLDPEARGAVKPETTYGRLRHPAQFIAGVLRALGARSADLASPSDGYLNPQAVNMGMDVFRPPSVFSYFSPGTTIPGTNGVRGPEFGIFSTSTALARDNFVDTMVFSRIAVGTNSPSGTALDLSSLQALAATPPALIDELDRLLLHNTMPQAMRDSIATAVAAVPASNPLKRARTAAYLVLTSSQYQVER